MTRTASGAWRIPNCTTTDPLWLVLYESLNRNPPLIVSSPTNTPGARDSGRLLVSWFASSWNVADGGRWVERALSACERLERRGRQRTIQEAWRFGSSVPKDMGDPKVCRIGRCVSAATNWSPPRPVHREMAGELAVPRTLNLKSAKSGEHGQGLKHPCEAAAGSEKEINRRASRKGELASYCRDCARRAVAA